MSAFASHPCGVGRRAEESPSRTAANFPRPWYALVVFLLTLVGLGGCSNNPYPEEWTRDGTLYYVSGSEPVSFDPTVSYTAGDGAIMDPVFPQYFRFNFLKQNPWSLELNLGLIEPIRKPIHGVLHTDKGDKPYDGESWTFELRHDIVYQDDPCFPGGKGRKVTAKDMEYTIKRMADTRVEFPLTANLEDKLLGWDDYSKGFAKGGDANYDKPLEGFELDPTNPYRFTIKFNQKYPQWQYIMAMHFTSPIPREAVEKYGDDEFALKHPVGCGPFKFAEYSPQWRVVLVRNDNCTWDHYPTSAAPGVPERLKADFGKPIPLVNRIVFTIMTEEVTQYNLFGQGYLDSLGIGSGNAQFMLHAIKPGAEMVKRGVKMLSGAYPSIAYGAFNMTDPTFGGYTPEKKKLRQAISLCIDSDAYIDLIDQGLAKKLETPLASGLCGYDEKYINPYRIYDPNLTKAKQLLTEAGYPNGIDPKTGSRLVLTMDAVNTSPADHAKSRFYIKEIEALGLHLNIAEENYPQFVDKVNHGKFQFEAWGWIADYPDSEDFLMLLAGPNGPNPNNSQYKNAEYDKLFDQVRSMDDGPVRAALIHKMRDIVVEDCPWIYVAEDEAPGAYQPWVLNQYRNPILNDVVNYYGVDKQMRVRDHSSYNTPVVIPVLVVIFLAIVVIAPAVRTNSTKRNRRVLRPAPSRKVGP